MRGVRLLLCSDARAALDDVSEAVAGLAREIDLRVDVQVDARLDSELDLEQDDDEEWVLVLSCADPRIALRAIFASGGECAPCCIAPVRAAREPDRWAPMPAA